MKKDCVFLTAIHLENRLQKFVQSYNPTSVVGDACLQQITMVVKRGHLGQSGPLMKMLHCPEYMSILGRY